MRLRFAEDWRTMIWAFVLFPSVPVTALLAPQWLLWLVPVALYVSYLSGVLAHNHNHCPMFASARANAAYSAWISVFYGFPTFAWVPTHNKNHHRHVNDEHDATSTLRHSVRNTWWAALSYPVACSRWQFPLLVRYAVDARRRRPRRFRSVVLQCAALLFGHAAYGAAAVAMHGLARGGLVYAVALGAPALLATYWMMLTNYVQHVDCEPGSAHNHSRNFTNRLWNWFVFDNGYHTVHHERPGLHWSRYRAIHASRAAQIDPRLNVSTPIAYLLGTHRSENGPRLAQSTIVRRASKWRPEPSVK